MCGGIKNKRFITFASTIFFLLTVLAFVNFYISSQSPPIIAGNSSVTISDQVDWEEGNLVNIDLTSSSGDIKKDLSEEKISSGNWYTDSLDSVDLVHDGLTSTSANLTTDPEYDLFQSYVVQDFDHDVYLTKLRYYFSGYQGISSRSYAGIIPWSEENHIIINEEEKTKELLPGWSTLPGCDSIPTIINTWNECVASSVTVANIAMFNNASPYIEETTVLKEIEFYGVDTISTHTSASTQLDGTEYIDNWTTFEPTATIPANTSVAFRFRTSSDASTWGDWTTSESYAASIDIETLLGATDAAKRYLQVESTLSNTDGASTPTLSDYTANYEYTNLCEEFDHLNISPSTATVTSGGSTTISATPVDAGDTSLPDISVSYSADCGSVSEIGSFTAPTVTSQTTCTVTATSDCGGSATSTITVTPPEEDDPTPTCNNNGIQDNGETGIDCGGGNCSACAGVEETYTAEITPSIFSLNSGETKELSIIFKNSSGTIVSRETVEQAKGTLTPGFNSGSSFFNIQSGGGRLSDENRDNLTINFTAGGTGGFFNNSIMFSTSNGSYQSYASPTVATTLAINVSLEEDIILMPNESHTFPVTVTDNQNQTVTDSSSFSWSLTNGGGTLGGTTGKAVTFTAGSEVGIYNLSVLANYQGASDTDAINIYVMNFNEDTEFRLSSAPAGQNSRTWVGEKTKIQLVIRAKTEDGAWAVRWGEDVKAEITDTSIAEITGPGSSYIFTMTPKKEGCYPFLVHGYWEKFDKLYETYIGFNIAGNDQSSSYYKYQPDLGASLFKSQNLITPDNHIAISLTRRDSSGQGYNWYNWIYLSSPLKTTWILNDSRLGTLLPHYNSAYLRPLLAPPGYYPNAITTIVTFRGQTLVENWDIWTYSKESYESRAKSQLSDTIPEKITVRPGSYIDNINKEMKILGLESESYESSNYGIEFDQSVLRQINSVGYIFQAIGEPGYYENAIVIKNNSSSPAEPLTKSIDLEIDPECEFDICTGGISGGNVITDSKDTEDVIGGEDDGSGSDWSISAIIKKLSDYLDVIAKSLLALAALSALLSYLPSLLNLMRGLLVAGKKNSVGVVYAATSGEPQVRKIVNLFDAGTDRLLKTDLTDNLGRFNFTLTPGRYYMKVEDKDIKIADNLSTISKQSLYYSNNYFGEVITVEQSNSKTFGQDTVNKKQVNETEALYNIPTMAKHEQEYRSLILLNLKNNLLKTLIYLDWPLLIIGTLFSIFALLKTPDIINTLITITYLFLWARHFITRPTAKSFGIVFDQDTKEPIPLAIVRALDYKTKKLIQTSVTSRAGHFSLNLQTGRYVLTVQKYNYLNLEPISVEIKERGSKTVEAELYMKDNQKIDANIENKIEQKRLPRSAKSLSDIIESYSGEFGP